MKKILTALLLTPIFFISHIAHADVKSDITEIETEIQNLKQEEEKIEIKDLNYLELSKKTIENKVNSLHKKLTDKSKDSEAKTKEIDNLSDKLEKRKQELNSSFGFSKFLGDKPILDKLIDFITFNDSVSDEMEQELNQTKEHNDKINEDLKFLSLDKKETSKELDKTSKEIEKSKAENKNNSDKKEELKNKIKELETKLEKLKQESKNVKKQNYQPQAGGSVVLSNGNTAGSIGTNAAKEMERRTGVSSQTWEYIIAKESNGNPNAYNPSGASGLFQTMPGWGSTNTVEDQINAAERAYKNQGLSAWGV